jgi:hypothetical protein
VNSATGVITTIAGNGSFGYSGDGGAATSTSLNYPKGVAVDAAGNVFIADIDNHRICKLYALLPSSTPSVTATASPSPYCAPALFRALPRFDVVGTLVGTALSPGGPVLQPAEIACRQACCDAALCDGYSFDAATAAQLSQGRCYLFVNITQLVPNNNMVSGVYESTL